MRNFLTWTTEKVGLHFLKCFSVDRSLEFHYDATLVNPMILVKDAMKKIVLFVVTAFLALAMHAAHAAKPTDAMLEELFKLTKVEQMMDPIYDGVEQNMRMTLEQFFDAKTLNAEQRKVLKAAPTRFVNAMKNEFNWEKTRPMVIGIYRETFTVEEVIAMIEFHRTPEGQSIIEKMPKVMQQTMLENQKMLKEFMPRLMAEMGNIKKEIDSLRDPQ